MFEIVFEFCAMIFVIVTVGAWVVMLPIVIKNSLDDAKDSKKYHEELRKELFEGVTSIEPKK